MLHLVTSALALTMGTSSIGAGRVSRSSVVMGPNSFGPDFGKLAASISMAAATPMNVDGKYAGGSTLAGEPMRTGFQSDFVFSWQIFGMCDRRSTQNFDMRPTGTVVWLGEPFLKIR